MRKLDFGSHRSSTWCDGYDRAGDGAENEQFLPSLVYRTGPYAPQRHSVRRRRR